MRLFGELGIPPVLRRARVSRTTFVLALLVLGGGALIGATGAAAGPAVSQTVPFTYTGTNACTGELFTGPGTMHSISTANASSSGAIQYYLDVRIDGLQAVTTPGGKKYVVQDIFADEFVFSAAAEETFNITAHFIRVGEDGTFILGDDFYEYFRTHITANANGMVTAFQVNTQDAPCQ
jgi:hypothetical protein